VRLWPVSLLPVCRLPYGANIGTDHTLQLCTVEWVFREVEWLGLYPQGMRNEFKAPNVTVAVANVPAKTHCYSIRVLYR
jgi:hypothetical protein